MKTNTLTLIAAACLTLAATAYGEPAAAEKRSPAETTGKTASRVRVKITLDEFKQMALRDNPSLARAKARVDQAVAGVMQARAAYYPTLSVGAAMQRNRDRSNRTNRYTSRMNYDASLDATWVLFDGFQRKFALLTAKYARENAEESERDARRLLMQSISSAFYAALNYQDNMLIAKEDAAYNGVLLEDARKRHENGVAKQSEVLNFILQVKNAEVNYVTAEQNWRNGMVALAALAAIDLTAIPASIWDYYELVPPTDFDEEIPPFDELLARAKENRPDLKAAEAKIINMRQGIEAAWNSLYPSVSLFADYGFNRDSSYRFTSSNDRVISGGLRLNWTLFNGFKTPAQIRQARAALNEAVKERSAILLDIESTLRQNIQALETSRKQYEYQNEILKTAREIRDLVHEEYLGGTTTITRLNESQTAVTKAASERSLAYVLVLNNLETIKSTTARNIQ